MNETLTPASKQSILLVDDDSFFLSMYATKFEKSGYSVQTFLSVDEALQALRAGFVPDIVIFDIVMPEKNGFDFLTTLRAENLAPDALKMALTNEDHDEDRARATELGVDLFMVKASLIPSEVVETVHQAVEDHFSQK